jgi:hypothetical protein
MLTVKEIQEKKCVSDTFLVSNMIGISRDAVRKHLERPSSNRLFEICKAYTKVIKQREKLLK